jgi:hypothetical protein
MGTVTGQEAEVPDVFRDACASVPNHVDHVTGAIGRGRTPRSDVEEIFVSEHGHPVDLERVRVRK